MIGQAKRSSPATTRRWWCNARGSPGARGSSHRLNDPAFAHAALARDDEVVPAANELPVAKVSICRRSMAWALKVQSKPSRVTGSRKRASRILRSIARCRRRSAWGPSKCERSSSGFHRCFSASAKRGIQIRRRQGNPQRLEVFQDALPQIHGWGCWGSGFPAAGHRGVAPRDRDRVVRSRRWDGAGPAGPR